MDKRKPSLQIDGLAIKNEKCYIVECKAMRLKRLMDEPGTTEKYYTRLDCRFPSITI
jgi:hypothetical protein